MKCYWKAHCVGDMEGGIALFQLAKIFDKTGETDQVCDLNDLFNVFVKD